MRMVRGVLVVSGTPAEFITGATTPKVLPPTPHRRSPGVHERQARPLARPPSSGQTMPPTSSKAEAARAKFGTGAVQILDLDLLGTHPENRGQLGVSSFHAHRVAHSILTDGLSRQRYRDCTVVKVPDHGMAAFRKFNEDLSLNDEKLPPFSPTMKYALLTKNHFVAALKLFRLGTVVFHESSEVIRPNPQDGQLRRHIQGRLL